MDNICWMDSKKTYETKEYFYLKSFPSILRSNLVCAEVAVLIPVLYLWLIDVST